MKKVIIPVLAVVALSLSSCHKERTCSCTVTSVISGGGASTTSSSTTKSTWGNVSKHEAASQCVSRKETYTFTGGTQENTYDCSID